MEGLVVDLAAEVKLVRSFVCDGCGTIGRGQTERVTVRVDSVDGLSARIGLHCRHTAGSFPVGWSSYYGGTHKCPACS